MNNISFTSEECKNIINLTKDYERISSDVYFPNSKNIEYDVWNIDNNQNTHWIFKRLFDFFEKETSIKIVEEIKTLHIHHYNKGQQFGKHTDEYYPTQLHNIGVCLNDDYVGGEFVLFNPDLILPKKTGAIYTFKSNRPHQVNEILEGERWSIISFLHLHNIGISKNIL
jgi:hypothetical protein